MSLKWHSVPEDDFNDEEEEDEFDEGDDEDDDDEEDEEEGTWYVRTELSDSLDFAWGDSL